MSNEGLPIEAQLEAIRAALLPAGSTLLLQAPPGAGKTTRVPLTLLEGLGTGSRILMLEPRRLAARNAAARLAQALGEPLGGVVGYSVRLESRTSTATRLELVTPGLFLRRLQADPELTGVACVIVDEFHERAAETDLALALLRQARALVRPDLRLLLMSATLDLAPLAERLDGAIVIESLGRSWPVEVQHQAPRPDERLERQVLRALECHWLDQRSEGETVLVFLPGQRELLSCQRAIGATDWGLEPELVLLHGQLSLEAQIKALAPAGRAAGKIVMATAIAESSLTIPGVRLVIDSGLSRRNRFDPATGMDGLITVPASQASAEQRRGRAGRLGPGRCLRLWSTAEQQRRPSHDTPELLEVDPLPICLQLAAWGAGLGQELAWIDPPPEAALQEAQRLLHQLGGLSADGRISAHGQAMARLGLHPRLAHMLLLAEQRGWLYLGCSLAVLLSERDPLDRREAGSDLLRRLDWLSHGQRDGRDQQRRQLQQLRAQLRRQVLAGVSASARTDAPAHVAPATGTPQPPQSVDAMAARLVSWAYPERVALNRGGGDGRLLMRGGRGALLHADDPLARCRALAIAALDDQGPEARVMLAVPLGDALLDELAQEEGEQVEQAAWDRKTRRVRCERLLRLGALVLERQPWPEADAQAVQKALLEGLQQLGLEALPWCGRSRELQQRLKLAHRLLGPPWPDRSDGHLVATLDHWLAPYLESRRSAQELQGLDLVEALWGDLDWQRRRELELLLPTTLQVPSGRSLPIRYGSEGPVLSVKLQEMFGSRDTPRLLQGRLPLTLELLSPAGRPAAITQDLGRFWDSGYGEVRRELRGRYPKHPWPEDPRQGIATPLTKAALARAGPNPEGP
ncbi:MAG: ATP-dependent helicase HrpB [Cyanobacteria bacterium]|nr:ATP-dependent helicase HrpB [Cyanobacteriota bacterium]